VDQQAYSDAYIGSILSGVKSIAIVGVTDSPVRASYIVSKYLMTKGYRVFLVNPAHAGKVLLGQKVLARLADIPEPVDMVDIFRRQEAIAGVVEEALALPEKPKVIWMQLGLRDETAATRAEAAGIKVVMDRCTKIEYGRLAGENAWAGLNSRTVSSKRPLMDEGHQHFRLSRNG
jgi:hypothetical protein